MKADAGWNLRGFRGTSRLRPGRWSAVLRIPIAPMLEAHPAPCEWRANFYRVDRGERDEFTAWSPTGKEPADFHEARRFGCLTLPI